MGIRVWVASLPIAVAIAILWIPTDVRAQNSRVDAGAGAGFAEPAGSAANDLNTGWNFDARGGYKFRPYLALDLDFSYNHWNLNSTALARYAEPAGFSTIWSVSLTPVLRGPTRWHITPYAFGGPGLYRRNLTLTQPALINTLYCDPFFGYCYPASFGVNQIVASSTTYKAGLSGGAGLEVPLAQSRLKFFGEARYSCMFAHGANLTFVPITFGLRW
jgi:hypothetical protein